MHVTQLIGVYYLLFLHLRLLLIIIMIIIVIITLPFIGRSNWTSLVTRAFKIVSLEDI